jgi:hypothetical protein
MADRYTVTNQAPTSIIQAGNLVVPAMEIRFTTKPHDVPGIVRIPTSIYSLDEVDKAIRAQVDVLEAVQTL